MKVYHLLLEDVNIRGGIRGTKNSEMPVGLAENWETYNLFWLYDVVIPSVHYNAYRVYMQL